MNNPILYISYDGLTDSLGQSQILPYIIGLSKQGYRFTIVSAEKEKVYACGKDEIQKIKEDFDIEIFDAFKRSIRMFNENFLLMNLQTFFIPITVNILEHMILVQT